jgi:hypothetical protein
VDVTQLAQDRVQWCDIVCTVTNLGFRKGEEFVSCHSHAETDSRSARCRLGPCGRPVCELERSVLCGPYAPNTRLSGWSRGQTDGMTGGENSFLTSRPQTLGFPPSWVVYEWYPLPPPSYLQRAKVGCGGGSVTV